MTSGKGAETINKFILIIAIAAILFAWGAYHRMSEELTLQIDLKEEMITDNDYLTKQNADLQKQIDLLQEKVTDQQETIDRLMQLETVSEVEAVGMTEARGEPLLSKVATLQTMLDRSTAWGMPVKSVIEASGQYAPPYQGEISDSMKTAFALVYLDGYRAFDENTTHFATYPASWSRGKVFRGKIGTHFYYGN